MRAARVSIVNDPSALGLGIGYDFTDAAVGAGYPGIRRENYRLELMLLEIRRRFERRDLERTLEMSLSCCMCEPMETPQSLGEDACSGCTAKVGVRARDTHRVWSNVSVGCEPGPST